MVYGSGPLVQPTSVTITTADADAASISLKLVERGVIQNPELFRLYLRWKHLDRGLQPGIYRFRAGESLADVAHDLGVSHPLSILVSIIPGWTLKQVAEALQSAQIDSAADFSSRAVAKRFANYTFVTGLPPDSSLEGYLYPDTYAFPLHLDAQGVPRPNSPDALIRLALDAFSQRLAARPDTAASLQKVGMSLPQAVTLASIVEREALNPSDEPHIAGVFYNRLAQGIPLQADPTVLYAMGIWKGQVTLQDLNYPSPYNTYLHTGLPPGPICEPGSGALQAVLHPLATQDLYFLADHHGVVHYARTLADFQQLEAQYLPNG
jgi:UPF0755 protein